MIVQYLLDAGEDVRIPGVAEPQTSFPDAVAPIQLALEQEKRVTEDIVSARQARTRGGRSRRRAVPALVPAGAARGGREHVVRCSPTVERANDNLLLVEDYLARTSGGGGEAEAVPPRRSPAASSSSGTTAGRARCRARPWCRG